MALMPSADFPTPSSKRSIYRQSSSPADAPHRVSLQWVYEDSRQISLRKNLGISTKPINCAEFEHRGSFADFVGLLVSSTNGNLSLAAECAPQICRAIWGTSNPDISGIGIAIGYIMANVLEPVLVLMCVYSRERRAWWPANRPQLLHDMLDACHESALFFAFSIQVACIVVLTRVMYGLDADAMGNLTVRITWTVATLSMIPLIYRTFLVDIRSAGKQAQKRTRSTARESFVLPLFAVCWAAFLWPCLSRIVSTLAPSQIGSGGDAVISDDDWDKVAGMCTAIWPGIAPSTDLAINAVGIVASLIITTVAFVRILYHTFKRWGYDALSGAKSRYFFTFWYYARLVLWVVLPVLAAILIWGFFVLQRSQKQLASAIAADDQDEDWSFGQVISVAVFVPVLVEAVGGMTAARHEYELAKDDSSA